MLLDLGIKTLWRRRLRSLLTILGVAAAVQLYLMLNGILSYYDQDIQQQVSIFAGKVFIQRPMGTSEAGEDFPSMTSSIDAEAASSILDLDGLNRDASSAALFVAMASASAPNMPPALMAVGIEPGHEKAFLGNIGAETGSLELAQSNSVLLGQNAAKNFQPAGSGKALAPGDTVTIRGREFKLVGILDWASSLYNGAVIMPLDTAQVVFNYPGTVSAVILTAARLDNVEAIKTAVKKNHPELEASGQEDIAENANQMISSMRMFFTFINNSVVLTTVMIIMIVVLIAVMEQRKEIGTLRALGARKGSIFGMVAGQSVMLGMLGGIVALPISIMTNNVMKMGAPLTAAETLGVWLATMGACIGIGVLASLLPAWQATRVDPLEALQFE